MNEPINLRYIPGWLNNVFKHHGAGHHDFDRIVSKHDLTSFKIANNQFRTRLKFLDINDFVLPDAELEGSFSEDEVLFALYGSKSQGRTAAEFMPKRFRIVPDQGNGIYVIEDESCPEKDLVAELVQAVYLYRGNTVAFCSSSFKRYLKDVKKYIANPSLVLDPIGLERFLKRRHIKSLVDHPLMLGDPTPPLNT